MRGIAKMDRRRPWFLVTLLTTVLMATGGCGSKGPSGKWVQNLDARRSFEAGFILQDHTYYYYGSPAMPDAVIAIDNRFTLQSRVWARVDINPKQMDRWMSWYRTDVSLRCPFRGGLIVTPDQQVAGMWYSKKLFNTVRSPEPGVIEVFLPFSPPGSACAREELLEDL